MARSRGELLEIIARGESILLKDGRVVSKAEDLPSAVELAGNDIVAKQAAVKELQAKSEAAAAELAAATASEAKAEAEAKNPPKIGRQDQPS